MSTPLRVLILEDRLSDAKLMAAELRQAGFDPQWERVETEADYLACLEPALDVILADHSMPQFNSLRALQLLRNRNLDIPFIFVSGTIGEDVAAQAMQEGAADYLLKDRLGRLGQAVRRALEQKTLREKARRAEDQLRLQASALSAAANGILITDPQQPDNPIIYVNPAFEQITQYAAKEVLGKNCRFLQGKKTDPRAVALMRTALQAGEPCKVELLNYRKDGTPFWNELSISPVRDEAGRLTHFIGIQADVTARRDLEQQFRQAQKMEAVGRLAGGVAHDFNNLLTIICGYGELLKAGASATDPAGPMLEQIVLAGEKAALLTRQLLTFSRQHVHEVQQLDLNGIIRESQTMLSRLIGEDMHIETRLASRLRLVLADAGHVNQILMNLAVNARDAMPSGGLLLIEATNVDLRPEDPARPGSLQPGPYVLLRVTDNGSGMDEAIKARIFEPFFTTKEVGKGTGLGLATVYGIVHQSGGHVEVESELGRGTTFRIYLPEMQQEPPTRPTSPKRILHADGAETILLVEDDASVRQLAGHVLGMRGYHVLEASGGPDALAIAEVYKEAIHLLLTDVVMPQMKGRALADLLLRTHPETVTLFMSGYTGETIARHRVYEPGAFFLQKPFTPESLSAKVRDVLDQAGAGAFSASLQSPGKSDGSERAETPPVRILIVDDHTILREGLRRRLQQLPGVEVVAEAEDGREAIAQVAAHQPGIVFMDIAMEGLNGLEATARLTRESPSVRVIMLSMHADEEHVWKALRAGAAGYLLKDAEAVEIELALAAVARGESYITPSVSPHLVAEFIRRGGNEASSVELLTSRQREILQLLAEGKNTKEIARMLSISAKTVETHRAQVMERLDIHDLTGLVRYALRVGLIQNDA